MHEIYPAYPDLLCGVIIKSARATRLTLHFYQTAVEEPFIEMRTRKRAGPRESHAGGIGWRISSREGRTRPSGVPSPQRRLGGRRRRGDSARGEPGRRGNSSGGSCRGSSSRRGRRNGRRSHRGSRGLRLWLRDTRNDRIRLLIDLLRAGFLRCTRTRGFRGDALVLLLWFFDLRDILLAFAHDLRDRYFHIFR